MKDDAEFNGLVCKILQDSLLFWLQQSNVATPPPVEFDKLIS